jgi:hypothetical protein
MREAVVLSLHEHPPPSKAIILAVFGTSKRKVVANDKRNAAILFKQYFVWLGVSRPSQQCWK